MKTVIMLQDTYVPGMHFKSYAAPYIAFLLRKNGFNVITIDRFGELTYGDLKELAEKYTNPDFLAVSAPFMFKAVSNNMSVSTVDHNTPKIAKLKYLIELLGPKKIVIGGASVPLNIPNAKIVYGTDEDNIYRAFDILIPKYRSDIQTLEHRFHDDDFILPNETLPLEISRGCIFNCKFCAFGLRGRDKFDYNRPPSLVVDEIEYNRDKYGTTDYYILCDTFNDTTMKIEGIATELSKRNIKISFVSYLRHDLLHTFPEQIPILKEMGIRGAQFGLETFNHRSGKAIGKGLHPDKVKALLLKLKEEWPETMLMSIFIVGLPYSTPDEHFDTIDWIKQTDLLSYAAFYPLYLNTQAAHPSEFALNADKYGYSLNKDSSWTYEKEGVKFDSVTVSELAYKMNELANGNSLTRAVWHEMPYLKDQSWESILANTHERKSYMPEYRKLLGLTGKYDHEILYK